MNERDNIRWLVIMNPNAGNGKGKKDRARIEGLFRNSGITFDFVTTEKKGHAIEITREAVKNGFRDFVSVGGDGTLNEIINGVFSQQVCNPSEITAGMIPVGTGNDWGRMFGIPLVYEGAINVIRERKTMKHDVGVVDFFEGNEKKRRYFLNIAGLGFEAMVVFKTNKKKEKGKSSKAIYLYNLLSSLISYHNVEVEITVDTHVSKARIFSVNVGNGRYCGGGMRQTPDALPDDGLLDITVIKEIGRFEIIRNLKLLYDGTILSHPKIDGYRGKYLKITSDETLYVEADGESLGHTPLEFSVIPSAINIVYGTRLIPQP
ncbi:MAG: diacylglycerol kinase family lipid kinase [Bacteroidales bacterium]|nr:diacylglycerol kinase family lipid kinase [Bacteroidales bacterium]